MKNAEERLEKERVMRVLKKASAGPGNNGNGEREKNGFGASVLGGKLLVV
jgi:hypothetical protein